jgi:hypothetical protein
MRTLAGISNMVRENLQKILKNFSEQFDLVNKAMESCKEVINNLITEDNGDLKSTAGFEKEELIYEFNKQTFVFNTYLTDIPFVRTEIGIYIKDPDNVWERGIERVGKYELDTNLSGQHIDDWLDFDKTKNEITARNG